MTTNATRRQPAATADRRHRPHLRGRERSRRRTGRHAPTPGQRGAGQDEPPRPPDRPEPGGSGAEPPDRRRATRRSRCRSPPRAARQPTTAGLQRRPEPALGRPRRSPAGGDDDGEGHSDDCGGARPGRHDGRPGREVQDLERPAQEKEGRQGRGRKGRVTAGRGRSGAAGPGRRGRSVDLVRPRARAGARPTRPGGPRHRPVPGARVDARRPRLARPGRGDDLADPAVPAATRCPQDYWDPSLQAWQMAWSGHALLTDPAQLGSPTRSSPSRGASPSPTCCSGTPRPACSATVRTPPCSATTSCSCWPTRWPPSGRTCWPGSWARAGSVRRSPGWRYAYAPWLLAQAGHLHIVSNGGIPLALAMLARGHGWSLRHGYRPERRRGRLGVAGWAVAAWQLSLGFGIGLPFAYVLAVLVLVIGVRCGSGGGDGARPAALRTAAVRRRPGRRAGLRRRRRAAGGAVLQGRRAAPERRNGRSATSASSRRRRAASSPRPAESWIWGGPHEGPRQRWPGQPEMTLLPGFVLYALAAGGLFFSVWRLRHRLLLLAGVLVTMVLAMGTRSSTAPSPTCRSSSTCRASTGCGRPAG